MIGIQMEMENCMKSLNRATDNIYSNLNEYRNIFIPIDQARKMLSYINNVNEYSQIHDIIKT